MAVDPVLTQEEKEHFLNNGWIKIPQAFTADQAAEVTKDVWTRLGMDPNDKATWHTPWTNMPSHRAFDAATFAPRAWAAVCELLGGEARVTPGSRSWRDSLIVNLGSPGAPRPPPQRQHLRGLHGWHVDGDFFVHYLDSPEQGLLVVPLFSDVPPGGGGTAIYPGGMRQIARHLYEHPEGVCPRMHPRGSPDFRAGRAGFFNTIARQGADGDYVEVCGRAGDVYVLHPLMLHSATNNELRNVRIITNPPVSLKEPFQFDREDEGHYSIVERTTLRMLGKEKDGLKGWKITGPRERIVPERLRVQEKMKQDELKRLGQQHNAVAVAT